MGTESSEHFELLAREKWMVFRIGHEYFAVSLHKLKEVIRYAGTIPLPSMPLFVEGVIHLRGQVICVLNVEKHLGFPKGSVSKRRSILILDFSNRHLGLVVDEVSGVREFLESELETIPAEVSLIDKKFLLAIARLDAGLVVLLDIDKMFSMEELLKLHDTDIKSVH